MRNYSVFCFVGTIGSIDRTASFLVPNTRTSRHATFLEDSRSICVFEPSDFALPTGEWPYDESDLKRIDNTDDASFYSVPRFVTHIDDRAIESLTSFYGEELGTLASQKKDNVDVLDLCSSWISHLPEDLPLGRVVGVGMNEEELAANKQLTEYYVQDMNKKPNLNRLEDESFDVICNVVSVDYLTSPKEIFEETYRVLRPGGLALISFSNRCFATKAVSMWLQADDIGRMSIVGSYFHYSAPWSKIEALDIRLPPLETPQRPTVKEMMQNPGSGWAWMSTATAVAKANAGDPMYVVKAVK